MKRLIVLLATLLLSFGLTYGANTVDVGMTTGPGGDTLRSGVAATFDIYIESDVLLAGVSLGWKIWSDDGGTWAWIAPSAGTPHWDRIVATPVTMVASVGRMGDGSVFDMTGLLVTQEDLDEVTPDEVLFGGAANNLGLPAGPSEIVTTFSFIPDGPVDTLDVKTICIDSIKVGAAGDFIFTDALGQGCGCVYTPVTLWPDGGKCWPIKKPINFCPEWSGGEVTSMSVDHCGSNTVSGVVTDYEGNDASFGYVLNGGGGTVSMVPNGYDVSVTYFAVPGDIGTAVSIEVLVWDAFNPEGSCESWDIDVTATNQDPVFSDCTNPVNVSYGDLVEHTVTAMDPDACDAVTYAMVSGPGAIDENTGAYTWLTDVDDTGCHTIVVSADDGLPGTTLAECTFDFCVVATLPYGFKIEKLHKVLQGHYVDLPITVFNNTSMGGFDLLLAYDNSLLTFSGASMSEYFQSCEWEYFTFRYGAHGNCGNGCPSGEIRLVGLAETNNGPYHPDEDCIANADGEAIIYLTFFVTQDVNANNMFAKVSFFWMDCADNSVSSFGGDTLFVSQNIYNYYGNDGLDTYIMIQPDPSTMMYHTWFYEQFGYGGLYGAPGYVDDNLRGCLYTDEHDKLAPIRFVDFYNGGIDIIDKKEIDDRGDINMNGLSNEIADAVMLTNYFINGLSAFNDHIDGSIAASDVNADGVALNVADLVYMIRIIIGDANAYADKPAPGTVFNVKTQLVNGNMNIGVETPIDAGAALFVFNVDGNAGTPVLHNNMDVVSNLENGELRVLVYNIGSEAISSGQLMTIPVEGSITLTSVETSDFNGNTMESAIITLPTTFSAIQNYPNPFSPEVLTNMGFNLNVASDWTIDIYNIAGQRVNNFTGFNEAGAVSVKWDATDTNGKSVASGIYFYKITAGQNSATMKMVLTK